ncbi:MAG TPA: hypothetical protein VKG45_05770 [Actinomycetes bacterium]|nr:hypothetical protein [Actinomycetes bacterium]
MTEVAGRFVPGPPKTRAGLRTVPLPGVVVRVLAEHVQRWVPAGSNGLLFTTETTGNFLQRGSFGRLVWRPAVARVGLAGLRFHDLRHTAATLAAAAGATTRELKIWPLTSANARAGEGNRTPTASLGSSQAAFRVVRRGPPHRL